MKRLVLAIVIGLVGTGVTAPSLSAQEPPVCTLIGCDSGIGLEFDKPKGSVDRFVFCVRDRCKRSDVKRNGRAPVARVNVECTEEVTVLGVLTARDSEGRKLGRYKALIPLKAVQPNGPGCPPTCFQAGVRFNGSGLVVLPQG